MANNTKDIQFLSKSLELHQRPFLITNVKGEVQWLNNASKYIFSIDDDAKPDFVFIDQQDFEKAKFDTGIADAFDVFMKINLRNKNFIMRVLLHVIPVEGEKYYLIEIGI